MLIRRSLLLPAAGEVFWPSHRKVKMDRPCAHGHRPCDGRAKQRHDQVSHPCATWTFWGQRFAFHSPSDRSPRRKVCLCWAITLFRGRATLARSCSETICGRHEAQSVARRPVRGSAHRARHDEHGLDLHRPCLGRATAPKVSRRCEIPAGMTSVVMKKSAIFTMPLAQLRTRFFEVL